MKRIVICALCLFTNTLIFSQDPVNMNVEELQQLNKDSLIKLALGYMDKSIEVTQYNIKVLANGSDVIVSFRIPLKYIPYNSEYFYDASVDIGNDFISYANYSNPEDYQSNTVTFYVPTEEHQENIKFIVNAINESKNENIVPVNITELTDDLIIREKPGYYDIEYISEKYDLIYKINKVTGEIYDLTIGNLEQDPNENEGIEYEEVED